MSNLISSILVLPKLSDISVGIWIWETQKQNNLCRMWIPFWGDATKWMWAVLLTIQTSLLSPSSRTGNGCHQYLWYSSSIVFNFIFGQQQFNYTNHCWLCKAFFMLPYVTLFSKVITIQQLHVSIKRKSSHPNREHSYHGMPVACRTLLSQGTWTSMA